MLDTEKDFYAWRMKVARRPTRPEAPLLDSLAEELMREADGSSR